MLRLLRRGVQNRILAIQNAIPSTVAARIAQQTMSRRGADYAGEVRRLLDAALEVMRRTGTASRARVSDIVAAAGLSNDAFYRHFTSKDALVAALLEDGTERLHGYLAHQMDKERAPQAKVRRWIEGVLSQADEGVAETTLAVLFNSGSVAGDGLSGRDAASATLSTLLHGPLAALGSTNPRLDASIIAHAVLGRLADHLWQRTRPTGEETAHIVEFCLVAVSRRRRRATGGSA